MLGKYKWYLILLSLIAITFALQISAKHQFLPLTNHFIPDSYAYELRVLNEREMDPLSDGFTNFNRLLYNLGPASFLIFNTVILLGSVYFCKLFDCISPKSVSVARFIIVFNPYLLIGAVGPNKETVLIFLSLLSFYFYFQTLSYLKLIGFLIAILALFIRPVFGLVLASSLLLLPFIYIFRNPINLFLSILCLYFAANSIPVISEFIANTHGEELEYFQGSNLLQLALVLQLMSKSPILQYPAFLAKTVLILITPIFRPNPLYSIPFAILDAGYTLIAYLLLPFNLALLFLFFQKKRTSLTYINKHTQVLIIYSLLGVLSTILNTNISFRYIFPYSPFIVAFIYLHSTKWRNRIMIFSISLICLTFILTSMFFRKDFELDTSNSTLPQFISWF